MTSVYHLAKKSCATDVLQPEHLFWTYSVLLSGASLILQILEKKPELSIFAMTIKTLFSPSKCFLSPKNYRPQLPEVFQQKQPNDLSKKPFYHQNFSLQFFSLKSREKLVQQSNFWGQNVNCAFQLFERRFNLNLLANMR